MSIQATPSKVQPEMEHDPEVDWESLDMEPPPGTKTKVDKGIPIPSARRQPKYNWPFSDLEIGDSFKIHSKEELASVRSFIHKHSKVTKRRFKTQRHSGAWRVWRTA